MAAESLCLLDGRVLPLAEARISPLDRGFLFGDAIYEAIKVREGKLLFRDAHFERLSRSLAALRIPEPLDIGPQLDELVAATELASGVVYAQVSRGVAPWRSHVPPRVATPTLFALATPVEFSSEPWTLGGLAAVSRADERWARCDVKTTALAATVLAKLEMADAGADEVLFVGPEGELREGGNTSLMVRDEVGWHTHPSDHAILPGVTRAVILEAAPGAGLAVEERAPRLTERAGWREALLCGTRTGVRGLVTLDGTAIGDGSVGAQTRELARLLDALESAEAAR